MSNPTLWSVCFGYLDASCGRLADCAGGTAADVGACIDDNMAVCCEGTACDEETPYTWAELEACTDDIHAESCAAWTSGYVPASCQ